jgi:release factor glutamine methyltransferase
MKKNVNVLLHQITEKIAFLYDDRTLAVQNAWDLLEKLTNTSEENLIIAREISLSIKQEETLRDWLDKLTNQHMPLQYILGSVPFLDVTIFVEPPILIPRPETEEWCEKLIETIKKTKLKKLSILDVCTGSGCIALALAKALPESFIVATDIHEKALALAKKNKLANNLANVDIIYADIFTGIPKNTTFDIIVGNPPYIAPEEWNSLQPEVKDWEDKQALVAADHGLALLSTIIAQAPKFLNASSLMPALWLEIGYQQGPTVKAIMQKAGFNQVSIVKDWYGKDRVVTGYYEVS